MKKILFITSSVLLLLICFYSWVDARWVGWGGSGSWWGDIIWLAVAWIIYAIYEVRRRRMIKKAKQDLENALKEDSSWDVKWLEKVVSEVFMKYQNAWSEKRLLSVKDYMTNSYYEKARKTLEQDLKWKKNIIKNITIQGLTLMSVRDNPWKDWDMFAMEVSASMIDYTVDENTWNFICSTMTRKKHEWNGKYEKRAMNESSDFKEYYIFIRSNGKWLLNNIKQKFSIVWDIIKLSEKDLRKVLENEKNSDGRNDDVFYKE